MATADRKIPVLALGFALCLSSADAQADAAACQTVLDAIVKQATVPVHQTISIESTAAPGKPILSEIIRTGDTVYMQIRGQWTSRPYDGQKAAQDARQAMQKAEHTCSRVRSEVVDGQAAQLYGVQSKTEQSTVDSQIWISSATGLPLRQHTEMSGAAKARHDVRFDYANVSAPANVRH